MDRQWQTTSLRSRPRSKMPRPMFANVCSATFVLAHNDDYTTSRPYIGPSKSDLQTLSYVEVARVGPTRSTPEKPISLGSARGVIRSMLSAERRRPRRLTTCERRNRAFSSRMACNSSRRGRQRSAAESTPLPWLGGYGSLPKDPKPTAPTPGKKGFSREVYAWLGSGLNCRLRGGWGRSLRRKRGVTFLGRQCL